jgi:hypothetical protein
VSYLIIIVGLCVVIGDDRDARLGGVVLVAMGALMLMRERGLL